MSSENRKKRAIPKTIVSQESSFTSDKESKGKDRHIPSTLITSQNDTDAEKQKTPEQGTTIPSTVVSNKQSEKGDKNKKRSIPSTVVSNNPEESLASTGKGNTKRHIPRTVVSNRGETQQEDKENQKDRDIFSQYNNLISSPVFTDPEGFNFSGYSARETTTSCRRGENTPQLQLLSTRESYFLKADETVIGKKTGDIQLSQGKYLSDKHAKLYYYKGRLAIVDLGSLNGTFIKIRKHYLLEHNDIFFVGRQVFQFQKLSAPVVPPRKKCEPQLFSSINQTPRAKLVYILENRYDITLIQKKTIFGKDSGTLVFPHDKSLSSPHAALVQTPQGFALQDLDSQTGVWLKLKKPSLLNDGDVICTGEYCFRVKIPDCQGE